MTQWEAFIKMYNAGYKEYFNPMFGVVKVKSVYKKEKKVTFIVQGNISILFTVNSDFKVSDNPFIKQCVFPNSNCDDFVTYVNTVRKELTFKLNAPVCIYRPHSTYTCVFGVLTKIYEFHADVRTLEGGNSITVAIDDILTIEEAKKLLKNKDNVQTV